MAQCYKTFLVRNLQIFVVSWNVCKVRPEKLTRDKHSGLLRKFVNYRLKKVYNIGPRGQYDINFFGCNLLPFHGITSIMCYIVIFPQ